MKNKKGIYIVFEGMVGVGKSIQSALVVERLKKDFPRKLVIYTKEPGGTEIAQEIRRVVQGMIFKEEMDPICEQYLYASSRAQSLRMIVKPTLAKGGIVLSDRSFVTSLAYQGFGRGLGMPKVLEINKAAVDGFWPDKVFFIDVKIEEALKRTKDLSGDKFEGYDKKFFEKVVKGYRQIAKKYPKMVEVIDGNKSVADVHDKIWQSILKLVNK